MESIIIHGKAAGVDDDGNPLPGAADRTVAVKTVQPLAMSEMSDEDKQGTIDVLRVWAPAGTQVEDGDDVTVRGERYQVRLTAWDWSKNRRPALRSHRPSMVFDCVRGEG
ncbi:hypothetical protein [Corynebacterium ulceribovis]|uniref:hypothetical protein n=1 Tax=Corynebacterium ulceribovis TaxID=487732 RepID=UPI0003721170|nr:hypothetical protein [Corynebacterium ulceribovis]